jgi:hypothetical protein
MTDHAYWDRERQEGPTDWGPGRMMDRSCLDDAEVDLEREASLPVSFSPGRRSPSAPSGAADKLRIGPGVHR